MSIRRFFVVFMCLLFSAGNAAWAETVSTELQQVIAQAQDEELPIIVKVRGKPDLTVFKNLPKDAKRSAIVAALRDAANRNILPLESLLASRGARQFRLLWAVHGLALSARPDVIRILADMPTVEAIDIDRKISAPRNSETPPDSPEWNINSIRVPEIWNLGYRGAGVVIATMDTGADLTHPDLMPSYRGGANSWFDPNGEHANPYDASGHGTQVLGVLAGGSAGGAAIGVAPEAQWIAVKTFNDAGEAFYSGIHAGFQWLLDPDQDPNTPDAPDVVNISWGLNNVNSCNLEFQPDVAVLSAAGIGVVIAAGNSGPSDSTSISPADLQGVMAVGALDRNNTIAPFSSRGPCACDGTIYPHLTAPGAGVRTSHLTYGAFPDSYITVSGTSIATPHAAGALAVLVGAFPDATVAELEAVLLASARDLGDVGADNSYGWGILDLANAFAILSAKGALFFQSCLPGLWRNRGRSLIYPEICDEEQGWPSSCYWRCSRFIWRDCRFQNS